MAFKNAAISGRVAVGSTTLAKSLSSKLNWPLREGNQIFRDISMQMGFDLEKNPQKYGDEVDLHVDGETAAILKNQSNIIVCSKLAAFLSRGISETFKVLVVAPWEIRVKRYSLDRGYKLDEADKLIQLREREDQQKFSRLYGDRDFFNQSFFDLVLDSNQLTVEQEVEKILSGLA